MALSARQLNRATLDRQLLLRRAALPAAEAVRTLAALQAQEPASPYLALWNRLADFDPAELTAAFANREVVKATLMRVTLHAVHASDYPYFHAAMLPALRAPRLSDKRFTVSGLSTLEADALLPDLADFTRSQPRTNADVEAMLAGRLGGHREGLWWALRTYAALHHAPTGGPWSFQKSPSYLAAPGSPPPSPSAGEGVQRLILRYLAAFGPALPADIAQFTLLKRTVVREALTSLGSRVTGVAGPGGSTLYDIPGGEYPAGDTPAPPRLLPMWDSTLLAYDDRSRILPPEYRATVIRRNGDVLPALLVDGYVAGVWRLVDEGIEATAFHQLSREQWDGLATEAATLRGFLADRDPAVYRYYHHWWRKGLPGADVRIVGG
ncbi:winged helix DNA-binding domain-containing protein [Longispora albida]|uniref:winged helix DNA-binding domain-containing protein n=1 Tax=Longispora albida TaxID=203523 RepID=UPI00036B6B0A|nr:winged helix DNA-binding domain-containing protein [Longispora albida]